MYSKKIKKINIVFLTIVYLIISCFGSISFAVASDTEASISDGIYYFENQHHGLYISDLDYFSVILSSFSGQNQQRWEFKHEFDSYYRIKNVYTGKYLTAPSNSLNGSVVEQASKFTSTQTQDRQLWSFVSVNVDGFEMTRIQAKSQENSGMYLASSSVMDSYGYALIQTNAATEYRDMWLLYPVKTSYFIGIDYNEVGHDHSSALTSAHGFFQSAGYESNLIITESITTYTVKNYLKDSSVFIIRGHGGVSDDNLGTCMSLEEFGLSELKSWDIYNYTGNNGIDMSKCEVAAFVGCETANHPTQSLPQSAVNAGADAAIGFETEIFCSEAETWTNAFASYHSYGYDAINAAYFAVSATGCNSTVSSMVVITEAN